MAEFHVHQDENAIYKIYKLTGPTGKVYIGCTKMEPRKRWNSGKGYQHNQVLNSDIQYYGWAAFEKEILCDKLLIEAAERLEDKFIQYYDSRNPEKGYNFFTGGARTGAEMSALGKAHCSESKHALWQRPEYIEKKQEECRKRYAGNPEMCRKTGRAIKEAYEADPGNRKRHSERMRAYYSKGNKPQTKPRTCRCLETGIVYATLGEAERNTGADHSHISRCCKGLRLTAGGYHWEFA